MTDATTPNSLDELGDALSAAAERDLHRLARRPVRRIALVVAALAVVTAGTAAAAGLFTPKQVASGMPAGAAIFDQTDPTCATNPDGTSYRCTLAAAPEPEVTDFTGVKEVLAIDGVAAGGCIGLDVAGMTWDCYIGQDAVDHEIISQDFLGEPVLGPGHG
jgi:cytosine/adenosine deaminase-related metal-dependent hydrolase